MSKKKMNWDKVRKENLAHEHGHEYVTPQLIGEDYPSDEQVTRILEAEKSAPRIDSQLDKLAPEQRKLADELLKKIRKPKQ